MDSEVSVQFDRVWDELKRQGKRIDSLEQTTDAIHTLAINSEKQNVILQGILEKIDSQSSDIKAIWKRLDKASEKPVDTWEKIKAKALDVAVTAVVTALVAGLAWLMLNHGGIVK